MPCIGFCHLRRVQRTNKRFLLAYSRCKFALAQLVCAALYPWANACSSSHFSHGANACSSNYFNHEPMLALAAFSLPDRSQFNCFSARHTACQPTGVDCQPACLVAAALLQLVWVPDSMGVSSFSCFAIWLEWAHVAVGNGHMVRVLAVVE